MAVETPTFWLYDRWGSQLGTVIPQSAVRKVEVGGDHTLTLTAVADLTKGQRVLFNDGAKWREFVVSIVESERAEGLVVTTATCEDSLCELNGDYIDDKRPEGTASKCLETALGTSRWEVGTVDVSGSQLVSMYHETAREAVNAVAEAFGGEVSATVTVSGAQVTHRYVNLLSRTGRETSKRFTYGKDLLSVTRTVAVDDVCTALYGYGKGLAVTDESGEETGGYSRKLTFGDINGGLDYVASSTALAQWGRPDGNGGKAHVFGVYENSDCEDMAQLLAETKAELERLSEPQVAYEAKVVDLKAAGFDAEGVGEGDGVAIVDECFDPPLRLTGRVLAMTVDYLSPEKNEVTLGNIRDVTDTMAEWQAQIGGLSSHSASWDAAATVNSGYIAAVVKSLNEQFNAGGSYKFESFEKGSIWASVPLDEDGNPTKTPATAIQLCGLGFRIASSVDENGEFEWTTFGTGEGFTASLLNAGVIKGGANYWNLETGDLLFKQGGIRDSEGKNYWNLDTGEFSLSSDATVGGETVSEIAEDAVDAQTQSDIFNKLTNNGQTQGIYLSGGLLYVNATYMKAGIISDGKGYSSWNLSTGAFTTKNMTANGITANGTFKCGSTYGIKLDSSGKMAGYRSGSQVGYIDYSASAYNVSNPSEVYYGLQMQADGIIRISTPRLSTASSSSTSETTTSGTSGTHNYITSITDNGDGSISWSWRSMTTINGLVTSF